MKHVAWLAVVSLVVGAARGAGVDPAGDVRIERCLVSFVDETKVPAQEAGVLVDLAVTEGSRVAKDDVIGRINDDLPQVEKKKAKAELEQAVKTAENKVPEEYAAAALATAIGSYNRKKAAGSAVTQEEMAELELKIKEQQLSIKKALMDREIAGHAVAVKQAEEEGAQKAIERRVIRSPLDGVVLDVLKHRGEWVQPGDTIARVVRPDQLLVKGHVPLRMAPRNAVAKRPVTVTVELDHGRQEKFAGRIVFVSEEAVGGAYLVHADVENRQVDGEWVLLAGLNATMTIQLGEPVGRSTAR